MSSERWSELVELLRQTARAHHSAFIETDGYDPDWPLWYAGSMSDRLNQLLGTTVPLIEVADMLFALDREQRQTAPDADWAVYYTNAFLARYTSPGVSG